jgi:integrase
MPGYIERVSNVIAALIAREGLDYLQTKAVFKAARQKAGLKAPKVKKSAPARLSLEEELRFIDQAYARSGQVGLMMQILLETGARVSEFTALRVEDVSLIERVVTIAAGKGGKRREVPIRAELAKLLALHIGKRRTGPLFPSREKGKAARPRTYTRQRIGQMATTSLGRDTKHLPAPAAPHHGDPPAGARHGHHRRSASSATTTSAPPASRRDLHRQRSGKFDGVTASASRAPSPDRPAHGDVVFCLRRRPAER